MTRRKAAAGAQGLDPRHCSNDEAQDEAQKHHLREAEESCPHSIEVGAQAANEDQADDPYNGCRDDDTGARDHTVNARRHAGEAR